MKQSSLPLSLAAALVLAGCASQPIDNRTPSADGGPARAAPAAGSPARAEMPPEVMFQLLVADIATQRGQLGVAVSNYLAAARSTRDPRIAARAARVAMFARALKPSLEAATLWVELAPGSLDARRMYGALLLAFGRAPEAEAQFAEYLDIARTSGRFDGAFQRVANQLAREQNRVAAMAVMEGLLAGHRDDPQAWLAHAWLSMRQGKLDQAMDSVEKAEALKPGWRQAVVLRARIMGLQGRREQAIDYLDAQLAGDLAGDPDLRLTRARLLTDTGRTEAALAAFASLADDYPDNVEVLYAAGVLSLQLERLDDAETYLKKVLSLGRRMLEANYFLGRVYEQRKDKEQAIRHYLAVRHGEFYVNARARAASLMAELGRVEQARRLLHAVRAGSDEDRRRLYLVEAELLRQAGQDQAAFDFLTEKLQEMPDDTALRYARALIAERLDKLTLAEQDLRAIIEREPDNAQALNALGYTLADRTDRYDEALAYIRRALEVEPEDPAIIDSMGWVQYRLGNLEKAREYLRRALDLVKDPEIAAHLGEVLWQMGDRRLAIEVWEEYSRQFPDHESLRETMRRFGL